ncbi:MAG TPA: AMP-binding protein [Eoetvoesiella sp.]|uniref:AMP-binding protein n=1 Tax=Eoetvoesiella sp. TaxID=1966355 RepID=UPI002C94ADC8|nr:AMP-binding protein [Eoetvoesiella sp.]HWK60292.1 AMP-binding protein [Eoetvoesiella sp.]
MSTSHHDLAADINAQRPDAPFRPVRFAPVEIALETRSDGSILLTNKQPLHPLPVRQLCDYLRRHAQERPQQTFLAEPEGEGWRRISYAQARASVDALSQWLLDRSVPDDRPIFVLSENGINHALLQLAAMQIGIPVMPLSAAYSLMSETCAKIRDLVQRFQPAIIYAADAKRYGKALEVARPLCNAVILSDAPSHTLVDVCFDEALGTPAGIEVEQAYARVTPDATARLLLTSGSTGAPKAVVMTQRNILTSGVLWDQVWPFLADEPLTMLDWLPWNHTAGTHGSFSMVLRHGGTLYIDDGKPVPKLIERSIRHLREVRPNVMINVPRGLDMLVACMEEDPSIAAAVFPNLQVIIYGGAALLPTTLLKLEQLSVQATGQRIPVTSSLGSTETTMPATLGWWPSQSLGTLGLPGPGVEAKLIPGENRYEIRFRGDNITPGYYRDPQANQASFDEEGFLITGDAVVFINDEQPEHGLLYAGRLSENFKLSTGTWVSVATVREHLLEALHPLAADVVLAAPNQLELGALLFLNLAQVRKAFPGLAESEPARIARDPQVLAAIREGVQRYNAMFPASSTCIARALVLDRPPSLDDGEITDKGHINQRGVLKTRAAAVDRMYGATDSQDDCLLFAAAR